MTLDCLTARCGRLRQLRMTLLSWILSTAACVMGACSGTTTSEVGGSAKSTGGASVAGGNGSNLGGSARTGGNASGGKGTATAGGSATGGAAAGARSIAPPCSDVTPCGGNVVGTWNVTASCLNVTGQVDLSPIGIGCASASVTGGALHVTGTWTAHSDGTYSDGTTTTGAEQFTLAASCLDRAEVIMHCPALDEILQAALGYALVSCTDIAGGGCDCTATVNQQGGMGVALWNAPTIGAYTTSGNVVMTTGGQFNAPYSYCISEDTLAMTPQTTMPTTTGKIVLQR
jgi:hypothetical protein